MARRTEKKPRNYPRALVFDESLEGVGQAFHIAGLNLPTVFVAVKGSPDHVLASALREAVFFTADRDWLSRQPPYDHGGVVVLDTGHLPIEEKAPVIYRFLYAFHIKNKALDTLRRRRFRLTKTALWEMPLKGKPIRKW